MTTPANTTKRRVIYQTEIILYRIEQELNEQTGEWDDLDADPRIEATIRQGSYEDCSKAYDAAIKAADQQAEEESE